MALAEVHECIQILEASISDAWNAQSEEQKQLEEDDAAIRQRCNAFTLLALGRHCLGALLG